MRRAIFLSVVVCLLAGLARAGEPVKREVLDRYAQAIGKVLPANWSARVDADGSGIWLETKNAVPMESMAPNGPASRPGDVPLMRNNSVFVKVILPQTQAEVAALVKANADRAQALAMLRSQMADMTQVVMPSYDTESFVAQNTDQQARLDAFVAVKHAMPEREVPELFAADASFIREAHPYVMPLRKEDQAEREYVMQAIASLFSDKPLK